MEEFIVKRAIAIEPIGINGCKTSNEMFSNHIVFTSSEENISKKSLKADIRVGRCGFPVSGCRYYKIFPVILKLMSNDVSLNNIKFF